MNVNWRQAAACAVADPDMWFADGGKGKGLREQRLARLICDRHCPVQEECLDTALAREGAAHHENRFGIWGGYDPRERYNLHRRLERMKPPVEPDLPATA